MANDTVIKDLGKDLSTDDLFLEAQQIRECIYDIFHKPFKTGDVYLDNIAYDKNGSEITYSLKNTTTDLLPMWNTWLQKRSPNVVYIPPECLTALPDSTGDTSKVDSWTIGCLLVHLLNRGNPLQIKRFWPNSSEKVVFELHKEPLLKNLQDFYKVDGEIGLVIGPEIPPLQNMPAACKDFLEHSLNINAGARSSLAELRAHPFVDRNKSLEALYALENLGAETYSVCEGTMKIINTQRHSFLNDTAQCRLQIGEIQLVDNPDMIPGKMVEIWRFQLLNESADRETYKKAFGKLLNLLTTTYSDNERIGRLQADSVNVIHFFAWQFASPLNPGFPPEFQVYAELCRGGNFEDAATHFLPIVMIQKLLYEMLCGLEFLHNNRIVHRNLNSRIIFFTVPGFKGTVKIGGFHNMRQLGTDHTTKHDISARSGDDGRFVAPELVNTSNDYDIGRRSDIWSVGCIALHLLTGQPPLYNGARNQPMLLEMAILYHLNNESNNTGRLPNIPDSLPKNTKEFVLRCLKFNPTERLLTSELLAPNGLLSRFNSDPDNPRRYQIQKIETLSKDTLDYWTNKVYPSST